MLPCFPWSVRVWWLLIRAAVSGMDTVTLEGGPSTGFVTVSFPDGPVEPFSLCGVTATVRLL